VQFDGAFRAVSHQDSQAAKTVGRRSVQRFSALVSADQAVAPVFLAVAAWTRLSVDVHGHAS